MVLREVHKNNSIQVQEMMTLLNRFFPSAHYDSIFDVDYDTLYASGIRGLMFDIDNTLVPYDVAHPTPEIVSLFTRLKQIGFRICLVSNNNETRVLKFNEKLKVYAIPKASKPLRRKLRKAMGLMGTTTRNTTLIGDQIFTDVLGGNRLGLKTILVMPVSDKDEWITKIKRDAERIIFNLYLKAGKTHE